MNGSSSKSLSIFTTILVSRIGSWQHYLKITSIALQVSMTLVKTDLGFLRIIQIFKIVGRETNNNKGVAPLWRKRPHTYLVQASRLDP